MAAAPDPTDAGQRIAASSLNRTLGVIGDAWTVLLLKELFSGTTRFQDFQTRLAIPRQTLSLRLAALAEHQCVWRKPVGASGQQTAYRLTPKGLDLYPFVVAVWAWHRRWAPHPGFLPEALVHRGCGAPLVPELRCEACDRPAGRDDLSALPGPGAGFDPRPASRSARQNDRMLISSGASGAPLVATTVIGDRWSLLILADMFRGTTSFFALAQSLGIASSILSGRLKTLTALGLIAPTPAEGRRIDYRPTDAGADLFTILVLLSHWGDRWLAGVAGPPEVLRHDCGAPFTPRLVCRACGETIRPWEVAPVGAPAAS